MEPKAKKAVIALSVLVIIGVIITVVLVLVLPGEAPIPTCPDTLTCATNQMCVEGVCVPKPVICNAQSLCSPTCPEGVCPEGETCQDGTCVNPCPPGVFCSAMCPCPSGEVCGLDGVCAFPPIVCPPGGPCNEECPCNSYQECVNGVCITPCVPGGPCSE